jgi:phosphoglucomutase
MRSYEEALKIAETWGKPPFNDDTITGVKALLSLPDAEREKAILDQFGYDLSFGTAGMRAIMDVGTARINTYTIARVSQAVANVIGSRAASEKGLAKVVIGYDGRRHSDKFARIAQRVYLAAGIDVLAFDRIVPTPLIPFTVRKLGASCGIMITSSHNAAAYNGYKVYAANGAQILSPFDTDVMAAMSTLSYEMPGAAETAGKLKVLDEQIMRDYVSWVVSEVDFAKDRSQKSFSRLCTVLPVH